MHHRGQIVDTSKSGGLTVNQYWEKLFKHNEKAFEEKRETSVLDDQDITAAMLLAFPKRRTSQIFREVVKARNRFNRGKLHSQKGQKPEKPSFKYIRMGGGGVRRSTARGRLLPVLVQEDKELEIGNEK